MPLPTTTISPGDRPLGVYSTTTNRGGEADPPPTAARPPIPWASIHFSWYTRTAARAFLPSRRASPASHSGFFVFEGVAAQVRAATVACARRTAVFTDSSVAPTRRTERGGSGRSRVPVAGWR